MAAHPAISSTDDLAAIRRSRRHPTVVQFDYLHLRALVDGLRTAIASVPGPIDDVLDVWCGSRPYEDLLPPGARCIGLDVEGNPYGLADVVSNELLPFADESFDLVTCIEAFHLMTDVRRVVSEFSRVLRPGGSVIVSSVFGFEYDRRHFEARYTEPELRALFGDWENVDVREDGGRTVTWAVLTASLLSGLEQRASRTRVRGLVRGAFLASYAALNAAGLALTKLEDSGSRTAAFPMNITLTGRKPFRD